MVEVYQTVDGRLCVGVARRPGANVSGHTLAVPARWRLANQLLADDVELAGLAEEGRKLRIVISQRDLVGEASTWDELHVAMTETYGLRLLNTNASVGGYEARAYAGKRFTIFDVRPPNCVRTAEGDVVPFDVIPQVLNRRDAAALRALR